MTNTNNCFPKSQKSRSLSGTASPNKILAVTELTKASSSANIIDGLEWKHSVDEFELPAENIA